MTNRDHSIGYYTEPADILAETNISTLRQVELANTPAPAELVVLAEDAIKALELRATMRVVSGEPHTYMGEFHNLSQQLSVGAFNRVQVQELLDALARARERVTRTRVQISLTKVIFDSDGNVRPDTAGK